MTDKTKLFESLVERVKKDSTRAGYVLRESEFPSWLPHNLVGVMRDWEGLPFRRFEVEGLSYKPNPRDITFNEGQHNTPYNASVYCAIISRLANGSELEKGVLNVKNWRLAQDRYRRNQVELLDERHLYDSLELLYIYNSQLSESIESYKHYPERFDFDPSGLKEFAKEDIPEISKKQFVVFAPIPTANGMIFFHENEHESRNKKINELLNKYPGLYIANAWAGGIGSFSTIPEILKPTSQNYLGGKGIIGSLHFEGGISTLTYLPKESNFSQFTNIYPAMKELGDFAYNFKKKKRK